MNTTEGIELVIQKINLWNTFFKKHLSSSDDEKDSSYVIESDEDLEMEMLKVCLNVRRKLLQVF